MNKDLENKLLEDFPWTEAKNVFTGEKLDFSISCECEDGWYSLIHNFCEEVKRLYKSKNANINELTIYQIKEKYGTLRIYLGNCIKGTEQIVQRYEMLSSKVCEVCGRKGKMRINNGWIKVLCDSCKDKLGYYNIINKRK